MSNTIELLENRSSVRVFEETAIDEETVETLRRLTLRAPSAGNMQLYTILEIKDKKKKEALAEIADSQAMIARAPLVWLFLADNHKWERYFDLSLSPSKTGIPRRPAGYGDLHLTLQDALIAAASCQVAAEALGLGSCYIGDVIENGERLVSLFDLPPHAIPACLLIMGRPRNRKGMGKLTPRPGTSSSIFMTDSYREHTFEDLEEQYKGHKEYFGKLGRLPKGELTSVADYYYSRKYTASFMEEMNRSMEYYLSRYKGEGPRGSGVKTFQEGEDRLE